MDSIKGKTAPQNEPDLFVRYLEIINTFFKDSIIILNQLA